MTAFEELRTPLSGTEEDARRDGRSAVRRRARGMTHHEVEAALEAARDQGLADDGDRGRAEFEEWERIEGLLEIHAGSYDPDSDPFVQGALAGEADRRAAERSADAEAARAREALLAALVRAGVLDGAGGEAEATAARLARTGPADALAVSGWLDTALATGRADRS